MHVSNYSLDYVYSRKSRKGKSRRIKKIQGAGVSIFNKLAQKIFYAKQIT